MSDLSFLTPVFHDANVERFVAGLGLGALMIVAGLKVRKAFVSPAAIESNIIPARKMSLTGIVDFALGALLSYQDSILGKQNRKYFPLAASCFFFILLANLVGLFPGAPVITNTVWINTGLAIVVFIAFNFYGVRTHGVLGYLKHFAGPVWWLAIIVFPVEILSTALRIFSLNFRLYWAIKIDHILLGASVTVVPYVLPILFFIIGTVVAIIQAFVFTTLTLVYIKLATSHEGAHQDDEHHGAQAH